MSDDAELPGAPLEARVASPTDDRANTPAAGVARSTAMLLELLARGAPGATLAGYLNLAVDHLRAGDVLITRTADGVRVNGDACDLRTTRTWGTCLAAQRVKDVLMARDASKRELLHFLALVAEDNSPQGQSFTQLWLAQGAWRVHARVASDVDEHLLGGDPRTRELLATLVPGESATLARDVSGEEVRQLCEEVLAGMSVEAQTPLGRALRAIGTPATTTLLGMLSETAEGSRRRLLFEAIIAIDHGHSALVDALGHPAWYVARNAALLVGEMHIESAADPLGRLLQHADPRVRVAAAQSLGSLGTVRAREWQSVALENSHAAVRRAAWQSWTHDTESPTVQSIATALRREGDPDVQRALLACVAAHPEVDVSAGLVRFCARMADGNGARELLAFAVELLARRKPQHARPFLRRLADQGPAPVALV